MNHPVRKKLPHTIPQWVDGGSCFFITINCEPRGRNHLARVGPGDAVLAAAAYYHEQLRWHCRVMLLMPDHSHGIVAFPRDPTMGQTIENWKRFLSRNHKIDWQRDFFDHRLRNHHELAEKLDYILKNPVRKGLCERAEDWPWVYRPNDRPPPLLS
jgi:putative transposase